MERGSGSEGRRRGGGQHMKCADRQMEELTEDKQTPCSHLVRHLRQAQYLEGQENEAHGFVASHAQSTAEHFRDLIV